MGLTSAVGVRGPASDELADPLVVGRLVAEAEEAGWDGPFVWDELAWPAPVERVAELRPPEQLALVHESIRGQRPDPTEPYDIAVAVPPGADLAAYVVSGATWCLTDFEPEELTLDHVRGVLPDGVAVPAPKGVAS